MDLFSEQIGAPFEKIESFSSSVGGSPSNVAIGASRLGLKTAVLTAVGQDKVGSFVRRYLTDEGVDTQFVLTKPEARTGMAVVGIEPPSNFPLTFYRENPADILVSIEDALSLPFDATKVLLLSGTALAKEPCRSATIVAAEQAKCAGVTVFLDLDLRPDQWRDPRAYGTSLRSLLPLIDIVIGTEEESYAALFDNKNDNSSTAISDLTEEQIDELNSHLHQFIKGDKAWVLKRGANGVSVFASGNVKNISGFAVQVVSTVGAGDAFASGLIYAYLQTWDWEESAKFANACGAIVVSRHGCSAAMPYLEEVSSFIEQSQH